MLYDLSHSLEVALIPVHYYMVVSLVEFMGQLLAKRFNGGLHESLFGVNIEHAVPFLGKFSYGVDSFRERFKYLQIVF